MKKKNKLVALLLTVLLLISATAVYAESMCAGFVAGAQEIKTLLKDYSVNADLLEEFLETYPNADEEIRALNLQARAYGFTSEQVNNYLRGMLNNEEHEAKIQYGILSEDEKTFIMPDGKTMPNQLYGIEQRNSNHEQEKDNQGRSFSSYYNSYDNGDQSGVYWIIQSEPGYYMATAFVTLPTITASSDSPDRPYMMFAANMTNSYICGDYGIVYYPSSQQWYLCRNACIWNFDTNKYDVLQWKQEAISTNYGAGSSLYLQLQITNTTTTDRVTIYVKDGITFNTLATIYEDFENDPFNSTLSNIYLFREVTMAQWRDEEHKNDPLNTATGTQANNSIFSLAYLYTPSNYYYPWGTSQTHNAYRLAPSTAQLSTISVNSYTQWDGESISIQFTQY